MHENIKGGHVVLIGLLVTLGILSFGSSLTELGHLLSI